MNPAALSRPSARVIATAAAFAAAFAAALAAALAGAAPALHAQTPSRAPITPAIVAEREARLTAADRGRIRGNTDAPVWVVVISDYQCPFCKKWHDETESRITAEYVRTGKVQIAYINYPIPSIHPNAPATHEAAMCAAEQGKFWPVSDALFASQSTWKSHKDITRFSDSLAVAAGVDAARFRSCIKDGIMKPLIEADIDRSTRLGVGSTPSFLVGGRPLVGAQPFEAFKQAIDAALSAAAAKQKPKP